MPSGYTRRAVRDAHGNIVAGNKNEPTHAWAFDPEVRDWVYQMFGLAACRKWSPYKHFDNNKVDDVDVWTPKSISDKPINTAYIGTFI